MDIKETAAKAVYLKNRCGHNCCQAVTAALAERTGADPELLRNAASGFAVGMGNMEATCGALIGAVIMAGFECKGKGTVKAAKQLSEKFRSKCGATICKELKGIAAGKVLCPCDKCVENAVLAYGEVFGIQ